MNVALRVVVLAGFLAHLFAPAALALDVTFDANATSLTIVDDGPGDLNTIDPGGIDFDLTAAPVGGVLSGSGRVVGGAGPIGAGLRLGGPPGGQAALQNVSGSSQTFTMYRPIARAEAVFPARAPRTPQRLPRTISHTRSSEPA